MYYDLLNAALVWAIFSYPCPDRLVQPIVSSQQSLSSALSSHGSGGWRTAVVRPGGFCATPLKGMNRSVDRGECEPTEQLNFLGPGGGGGTVRWFVLYASSLSLLLVEFTCFELVYSQGL